MMPNKRFLVCSAFVIAVCSGYLFVRFLPRSRIESGLKRLAVPPGFRVSVYAWPVPDARQLALSDTGIVYVGSRSAGKVYALPDRNKDNRADTVVVVADGLRTPNGVAFRKGALYVAEQHRILRYDSIDARLKKKVPPAVLNSNFPKEVIHSWKYIRFGPDGMLYISMGAPCNSCKAQNKQYATILRMAPDGKSLETFLQGVRNCDGFDWDPRTKKIWFTDNGRDWPDQDIPCDELNHAARKGLHFGFPYCHGYGLADPEYGSQRSCRSFIAPVLQFRERVTPLGMRFYTGSMFPAAYTHKLFIAEHGSSGPRGKTSGYRISMLDPFGPGDIRYGVFIKGWQEGKIPWGRPVDVLVMPDGALLVSDDRAGAIYRITYNKMTNVK